METGRVTSPRITFVVWGKKPHKRRLPGLDVTVHGRYDAAGSLRIRHFWRCCLDGLFSN